MAAIPPGILSIRRRLPSYITAEGGAVCSVRRGRERHRALREPRHAALSRGRAQAAIARVTVACLLSAMLEMRYRFTPRGLCYDKNAAIR